MTSAEHIAAAIQHVNEAAKAKDAEDGIKQSRLGLAAQLRLAEKSQRRMSEFKHA
jgi:hypothetical protein